MHTVTGFDRTTHVLASRDETTRPHRYRVKTSKNKYFHAHGGVAQ
jgi:hypothetical protein